MTNNTSGKFVWFEYISNLVPPTDIPGVGRFAILADPQGATLGILQG